VGVGCLTLNEQFASNIMARTKYIQWYDDVAATSKCLTWF